MSEPLVIGIDPSFTGLGISDGTAHAVFAAPDAEVGEERAASTRRRSVALVHAVAAWILEHANCDVLPSDMHVFIEAPMLGANAGHLYELGFLAAKIDHRLRQIGIREIVEVPSATLRKFIGLPGNAAKIQVPVRVLKRFGVEFDGDRGADMAFAYVLVRYGRAVLAGDVVHVPTLARGQKARRGA